jgi:hypothetical protein
MCSNGWPPIVTFKPLMCVKSEAHSRPGKCTWLKNTSLAGPQVARQAFTPR